MPTDTITLATLRKVKSIAGGKTALYQGGELGFHYFPLDYLCRTVGVNSEDEVLKVITAVYRYRGWTYDEGYKGVSYVEANEALQVAAELYNASSVTWHWWRDVYCYLYPDKALDPSKLGDYEPISRLTSTVPLTPYVVCAWKNRHYLRFIGDVIYLPKYLGVETKGSKGEKVNSPTPQDVPETDIVGTTEDLIAAARILREFEGFPNTYDFVARNLSTIYPGFFYV